MANGHGGARAGAGRKPNREKYAEQLTAMQDRLADGIPDRLDVLELLADGGYEQIVEVYEPAGLVQITKELIAEDGRSMNVKELAFPELPPEQLVCVKRTRSFAAPDRKANEYLIDRIAGRPTQAIEATGEDGGPLFKVYVGVDPDQV